MLYPADPVQRSTARPSSKASASGQQAESSAEGDGIGECIAINRDEAGQCHGFKYEWIRSPSRRDAEAAAIRSVAAYTHSIIRHITRCYVGKRTGSQPL